MGMKQVTEALSLAIQAQVPTIIWGLPGVGKTARIKAIGEALGLPVKAVIAAHHDPTEFNGLPVISAGQVVRVAPNWAKNLVGKRGIVFLDELSTAPPAVQAAILRFVGESEREIGDVAIPQVSIVAAANPPELAAGGWDLEPPTANRFIHLEWEFSVEEMVEGFLLGWEISVLRLPEDWKEYIPWARTLVAGFWKRKKEYIARVPEDPGKRGRGWPSPRTWDMAATLMAAARAARASKEVEALLVQGAVGLEAATEFLAWKRNQDLPDPEELLKNPEFFRLKRPARGYILYSILLAVVGAVAQKPSPERYAAAWDIMSYATDGGMDVVVPAATQLVQVGKRLGYPHPKGMLALAPRLSELFKEFKAVGATK